MSAGTLSTCAALRLVARGVFLEAARRGAAFVVLILAGLFVLGLFAVTLVGIENPQTGTFILNLGMTLGAVCAHGLTLILASRQLSDEIENRTVYTLLARPLGRGTLLTGKWLACVLCGWGALALLMGMGWLMPPKLESYHPALLAQAAGLQALSVALMASVATVLPLVMPRAVVLLIVGLWYVAGGQLIRFAAGLAEGSAAQGRIDVGLRYLPDFSRLSLVTRYTDGAGPLSTAEGGGLAAYALAASAFFLVWGAWRFQRRSL